jgi:UDP-N-acetylmuramoyl-L-alanyl-D-glutamate--2,6-diaminopimelate ligase
MKLKELLADMPLSVVKGVAPEEVTGITKDSREVQKGYIYFATASSASYVADAVAKGASVIISDTELPGSIPCMMVAPDVRLLLGKMAARFYGYPSRDMHVTGITGTNGKTTITYLIESMMTAAGKSAGIIGTISCRYNGHVIRKPNTTPESTDIQSLFKSMHNEGVGYAVMEVSSHALDQGRVEGIDFDCVVFTNLTHDHLDYHGDFEHYRDAKALLFTHYLSKSCKEHKRAIINMDDPNAEVFLPGDSVTTLTYSVGKKADGFVTSLDESMLGLSLGVSINGREMKISTPLLGSFNASNILAAALAGNAAGLPFDAIEKGIEDLPGVPGRLERVRNDRGFHVFVDYAHTPDALKKTVETINRTRSGRLILVFGCGGDRDRSKRPVMGRIASDLADFAIITSDNPRTEDPGAIISEIKAGITGNSFKIIEDRRNAISEALSMAHEKDVVLIAGKGHEEHQIIGRVTHPFSDRQVVEELLDVVR